MFTFFSRSIDVTVTSENGVPSFHLSLSVIYTYNNHIFVVCCVEMVRKRLQKHKNENLI